MSRSLEQLCQWYQSQCNRNWEQQYGIKIESLDNPGWFLEIDLAGTRLERREFRPIKHKKSSSDWMYCKTENLRFLGYSDPGKLDSMIDVFLKWQQEQASTRR